MPMYNPYNGNYSMISGNLWNYYKDEVNNDANEDNDAGNYRINKNKTKTSESFEQKIKITGSTSDKNRRKSCCSIKIFE